MIPRALTIAGSDPSGGAGIQQDLKTFQAFGVWGMSAITTVTVQTPDRVIDSVPVRPGLVAAQIEAALSDEPAGAVKTGLIPTAGMVEEIAASLRRHAARNLVVDPVLVAGAGAPLAGESVPASMVNDLFPLAALVTPNLLEVKVFTGMEVTTRSGLTDAAGAMRSLGAPAVLVTGGHLLGEAAAVDVLACDDEIVEIEGPWIDHAIPVHGTGCMLSASIAAGLALGRDLETAVRDAKAFVSEGIRNAMRGPGGSGSVNSIGGRVSRRAGPCRP